jgi:hypothetical protein
VEPTAEFAQLQLGFVDQTQRCYEVIRPLVLFADRTAGQRARDTQTHPDTVRELRRRFQHQGMPGLLPSSAEVVLRSRTTRIPDAVRQELDRLKALYDGFHYRELARILLVKVGHPIDDKTVKKLWQTSPVACQGHLGLWDYHTHPDRYQARLQPTRFASRQGRLIPLTPQDSLVVYRAKSGKHRTSHVSPPPQLLLFEVVAVG